MVHDARVAFNFAIQRQVASISSVGDLSILQKHDGEFDSIYR